MTPLQQGAVMKKARFTDEQIVRILQEADRDTIAAVARRQVVSESSVYVRRKRCDDMGKGRCGLKLVSFGLSPSSDKIPNATKPEAGNCLGN